MQDRVVVITGGSAALAAEVARRGARPVIAARVPGAIPIVTDGTRRGDGERLLAEAVAQAGRVDVWVDSAGRGSPGRSRR